MGDKLTAYFDKASAKAGQQGRLQLAMHTRMSQSQAQTAPDSPDNLKHFEEALSKIAEVSSPHYRRALTITQSYLGDEAAPFLSRQCKFHLGIEPDKLSSKDMEGLGFWCTIGAESIIDKKRAQELGDRIKTLKSG